MVILYNEENEQVGHKKKEKKMKQKETGCD